MKKFTTEEFGIEMSKVDFALHVYDQMTAETDLSTDEFLFYPERTIPFCDRIRKALDTKIDNCFILWCTMDVRKHPQKYGRK